MNIFKKIIATRKHENPLFFVNDPLTRLILQFSHVKKHKFRHGFANTVNPMCSCGAEFESTEHFLLCYHFYSTQRSELFDNLEKANSYFKNVNDKDRVSFMLYGWRANIFKKGYQNIIKIVIKYLKKTGCFDNFSL